MRASPPYGDCSTSDVLMKPGAQEVLLSSQYDKSKGACTLFPGLADVLWSAGA